MPPLAPAPPRARFPSVLLLLISLVAALAPRVRAAPEPAALATTHRAGRHPAPLPPHLRQSDDPQHRPLPEAIRSVRFNAPVPARGEGAAPLVEDGEEQDEGGFQLSPLVLTVTVDGQVHALKRDTGQWVWTLHDDGGIAVGGVGRATKEERLRRSSAGEAIGGPLVQSQSRRRRPAGGAGRANAPSNETGVVLGEPDDGGENDETYIIEPTGEGDIYVYSRSTGGLDKLPLSMQELVTLSPFRFPGHASRMFSASKNTKFVGVDLKTGRLVGVFGSNVGWCEWDDADELTAGGRTVDYEEDIDQRPEDLLYMARTEYRLSIYDTTSSLPLQTLSYTTYTSSALPHAPASPNFPSQSTWTRTPDSLYLQPMHDGSLVCFRAGTPGYHWSINFEAPVVSVFDVVVPLPSASSLASTSPLMLEQPHPLLVPDLPLDFAVLQQEPAATFVGRIGAPDGGVGGGMSGEGELFAMSRDRFPLVPFAQVAEVARGGLGADEEDAEAVGESEAELPLPPTREPCRGVDCLIGRHRLRTPPAVSPIALDATLDPATPSEPLLLDGPSSSTAEPSAAAPALQPPTPNRRTPHQPGSSTLLASLYKSSVVRPLRGLGEAGGASSGRLTAGVALLVLAAWAWGRLKKGRAGVGAGGKVRMAERGAKGRRAAAETKEIEDELPSTPRDAVELAFTQVPGKGKRALTGVATSKAKQVGAGGDGLRKRSPSTPPTPTGTAFSSLAAATSPAPAAAQSRGRASSLSFTSALSASLTLSKELPPLPPSADDDPASLAPPLSSLNDGDSSPELSLSPSLAATGANTPLDDGADSDGGGGAGGPGTPPRKRNRRRRGAKKKKPKDATVTGLGLDELDARGAERELLEGITLSERDTRDEDGAGMVDGEGRGVDGEASGASAPRSTATLDAPGEAVASSAVLDPQVVGGLAVSETILGYGSHGTVVLRGEFQGRAVAVKRLLKDFVTIAAHEVNLLQDADDHPHVIRYFCKEQRDTFLYIALELCPASLFDLIDQPLAFPDLVGQLDPKKALRQITSGLRHLHSLKIVHRDIKPQNILVSTAKRGQPGLRMLISDFGLCKKLDVDESSFQQTFNHAAGSFGYRAPEVLRGLVDPNEGAISSGAATPSGSVGSGGSSTTLAGLTSTDPSMRLTRSIDIFSLGCIFYYVLTRGEHPFGGRYEREMNILNGKVSLDRLDGLGEEAVEVQDLILRMVATDPRERPPADSVLLHPFFWNAQKRLLFICDASDRFEIMTRDPPEPTLLTLERRAHEIVGDDWQKALDRTFLDNLGKYRKYDGASVRDLLRVLRNKKHHYQDLPETVRKALGDLPGGFLSYFTSRFPHLLLHVYDTVATHVADEAMFASTFRIPEDEG
ncbi:bifunctional endoribonuclease/protein kinase ire1 [Rhodotorula kratochvilovae]